MRGAAFGVALGVMSSVARAQSAHPPPIAAVTEVDEDAADRRRTGELIAFGLTATTYGLRVGTMIEWAAGRRADDGEPETFWILPAALAVASGTGALLVDHYFPMRRGRGFSAGVGTIVGYIASLALAVQLREESFPSSVSITGPATFIGSTSGLAAGIALGHLTDATPGQALYVGTGSVGGALLGTFFCGALRCGTDLGAWALAGEAVGFVSTIASVRAFRPSAREMRLTSIGGVAGLLPAGAVLTTYLSRDGGVTEAAWARVSVAAIGGLVVGGLAGYAIARATRSELAVGQGVTVLPTLGGALGRSVGVTVMGAL